MKKTILVLLVFCCVLFSFAGCGEKAPDVKFDDIMAAIQTVDPEFAFDSEEKPYFEMIGACDGWIGYIEGSPIKVYEFENQDQYDKALETYGGLIEEWPKAGNFVLECQNESVVTAFENLTK